MESTEMDEEPSKPLGMELQTASEGEDEHARQGEINQVAIVNNEHAYPQGAGPQHMGTQGAGVSEYGTGMEWNVDFDVENSSFSETTMTTHLSSIAAHISNLSTVETEQDSNSNFSGMQETGAYPEDDIADADSVQTDSEERRVKEKFNVESLSYELQVGYRILSNLMSASNRCVNKLFLYPVDDTFPETADYYEKIKEPMWMFKMKEKFERQEYQDLTEFMADFRLMIENCYRFNGPDNFVSKKAQKLETMMKQKVALLSRDLREKIMGSASSNSEDDILASAGIRRRVRNPNASSDDPSQQLLSQLRRDRELQEKVDRKQKVEDRKAMEQARLQELQDWEDRMLGDRVKELVKTMWELPQIGLFVYLCMESLGLEEEVTQYQLERGLALPRECTDFKRLMTCLLSTPHQRKSLKSFMPYQVWNEKLSKKVDYFYKVLSDKNGNQIQACYLLGLDTRAFKVMGKRNPLLKKQFHELDYVKRVWILKNYCDFCMETQTYLPRTIDDIEAVRPMDVREVPLGSDGRGYRYINFPMFTGKDIRIYKHPKLSEPTLESLHMEDWSVDSEKMSATSSRCSTPVNPRSSRLAETPSTSLRARALLQAAESKEASPMRDTSRSGSEAPDTSCSVSSTQNLTSDTQEQSSSTSKLKPTNTKKRKRTSLFFSKRKRLKPSVKKTDSNGKGDDESVGDQGEEDDIEDGSASVSNGLSSTQTEEEKSLGQVPESVNSSCDIKSESANSNTSNKTNKSKGSHVTNGSIDTSDKKLVPQQEIVTSRSHQSAMDSVCEAGTETPLENVSSEDAVSSTNHKSLASGSLNSKELSPSENVDGKHDSAYISGESDSSGKEDRSESASNGDSQAVIDSKSVGEGDDNGGDSSLVKSEDTTTFTAADDRNQSSSQKNSNSEMKKATVRELVPEDKEISKDEVGNEKEDEGRGEMKVPVSIQCSNHIKEEILGDEEGHSGSVTSCDVIKKENGDSKDAVTAKTVIHNHGDGQDIKVIHDEPVLPTASVTAGTAVDADKNDLSPLCRDTSKVEVKEEKVSPHDTKMEVVKEEAEDVTAKEEKKDDEEEEEDSDEEDLPDLGRVELIAESMEEIRQLMHKLSNPDPIKRGKRVYPGVIKPCEEELLANLTRFHDELLKYERNLVNARVGMQTKLRKEVESYVEPKVEEAKGWDSDHSQSSKDSSDEEEDSDNKTDTESVKQTRKSKPKSATAALLTSAASRLSNLSGEGNEDSNDSFELDISSRGRLRKRRIIPNNTEDTGLKKRKNLPNQDAFFSTTTATSSPVTSGITTQVTLPNIVQRQPGKPWPSHIISMLTSTTSNSAIKAQLAAQTTRPSGQIVRLVTPGADGTMKTIRVAGKPNMIISPQSLSNIRFISNTGVVTLPRNRVVTSSSAQSSHPVIQQLLLNQARPSVSTSLTTSVMANKSSTPATGLLQKHIAGATAISQSSSPSPVKVSLVITAPSSVSTSSAAKSSVVLGSQPATAAVVVTQVSTSVSQGGKQVLDLGSLSVTQLQQLMKNQAIQINTGAGNSTTLLLTTGLQHLAASRTSGAAAGQTPGTVTQVRIPVNQSALQAKPGITGASSLLAMINKAQRPQTTTPQILLNNKLNPLLTFSNQLGPQGVRPQVLTGQTQPGGHVRVTVAASPQSATVVSQGLNTAVLQAALARSLPFNAAGGVLSVVTQPSQVSKSAIPAAATVVTSQKLLSAPRIISSLSSASSAQVNTASSLTAAKSAPSSSLVASSSTSRTQSPEFMKSRIITVPLVHMSPTCKKYANNVTVKALLENRTTKKNGEEDGVDADTTDLQLSSPVNGSQVSVSDAAEGFTSSDGEGVKKSTSVTTDEPASKNISNATIIKTLQTATVVNESDLSLGAATTQTVPTTLVKSTLAFASALTLPLSVETAIQPLVSTPVTTSEIILPTMNIKVPSPNTLPSVQHNKNGTTIVHATKVPIPMASEAKTGDSLSPSGTAPPPPPSSSQLSTVQSVISVPKSQPIVNNNLVILPAATSTLQQPSASPALAVKALQIAAPRAGLKNVTLKVTPQNGGSGQYVQGFMTPRGLVIPQTAFLQRQQAGNVVLASSSQPGGVAQIQSSPVLAGVSQQNILNIAGSGQQGTAALAPTIQQQQPQKVIVAAPNPLTSSSQNQTPLVNQNAGSNLKFVVLNPSSVASSHLTSITPSLSAANQQTSTPAAELVKQIASNSQIQTNVQQKVMNPVALNAGNSQQNTVRLLSSLVQGSGVQQNIGASIQTVGGLAGQSVVNSQTGVSPQLAAQILALQQNNQLQQQQQQQQPNIVLTAKPAQSGQSQGVIQSQNKPSVVTFQLQQLGQLFSSIGGVTQLQVAGTPGLQQQQQQQQQQQIASLQQQLGTRIAQPNQVVQLAINPASGSQAILATPQTPQVVRVASQLSPQLQLASQGVAQLQPNGNIVIQQQPALLSQQQNQSIILQQPGLSQSVVGPSSISLQSSGNHQQLNSLQQQLAKVSQQSVQKPQTLTTNKVQQGSSNLAPGQQMISASQASNLVFSQLQAPTVSLAPSTINQQQQVQFLIPSNASVPSVSISSLTSTSSTTNKIPAGTLACASNVNRVIRADSALVQTNLSPQNTGVIGLSTSLAPANGTSQTMVVGSSVNNNTVLTTAKPVQQVIIPNSGAGQFLISPVKLAPQAPQANLVSPIKFVGAVHAQTPGSVLSQTSTQLVVNNQPTNSALPGLQNQMPIKPSVIYAGHPVTATDKKEGKIAQILLSQPISKMNSGQSQIIVNNNQTAAPKLAVSASTSIPAAVPKLGNESNSSLNSKTFLYKIGDQYFSPAAGLNVSNMQVMSQPALPSSVMSTPVTSTTTSKPDVQLLVPPAFIEASDQILKQSSKPLNVSHVPASAVSSGGAVVGAEASSNNSGSFAALSQNFAQVMQKGSQHSPGTVDGPSSSALQITGSVNGIHQGNAQFSFSLSGPSSINNKQVVKPANTVLGNAVSGAQVSPGSVNQSNNAAYQSFNHGPVAAAQSQQLSGSGEPLTRNSSDRIAPRRNTFSGSQDMPGSSKGQTPQRHLSVDDSSLTLEERDEKEAALNLLTLANQQI